MDSQIENLINSIKMLVEDLKQDENFIFSDELNTIEKVDYNPFKEFNTFYITDNEGNKFELTVRKVE